eukprot:8147066-Lingulodinium_polyedra.AAC.1
MSRAAQIAKRAPWWLVSSLELKWGLAGGPRCPYVSVLAVAAAAWLSGRACGPSPAREKAREIAR